MSRALSRAVLVAVLAGMSLMLTGGTAAALIEGPITIEAITIDGGVAVVTGTIDDPDGLLQINGAPVLVGDSGDFLAKVNLHGDALELELLEPGELVELTIPAQRPARERRRQAFSTTCSAPASRSTFRTTASRSSTARCPSSKDASSARTSSRRSR